MKKRTLLLGLLLPAVLLALAIYVWFFVWNKPALNIEKAKAITIEASALFDEYSANEKAANAKYIDKVLEVSGEVTNVSKNAEGLTVIMLKTNDLMFGVNCTMEEKEVECKAGDKLTLKGICTGYLTDVVLIRCHRVK